MLTLTTHPRAINARANYHYIVDTRETTLAVDPRPVSVQEVTVGQNCSLIQLDPTAMKVFCAVHMGGMEELPAWLVNNLVRSMSENINYRIRGVEYTSLGRKI